MDTTNRDEDNSVEEGTETGVILGHYCDPGGLLGPVRGGEFQEVTYRRLLRENGTFRSINVQGS